MALHVQCRGCGTWQVTDCGCPSAAEGESRGGHPEGCPLADLHAQVTCPPGSGCCSLPHDHIAASACPGTHDGECGLGVPGCNVCRALDITMLAAVNPGDTPAVRLQLAGG